MASPSSVDVTRLAPQAIPQWPAFGDDGSEHLAHAPEWASVIGRAYGHAPLYLAAEDRAGHRGLLPAFIVRRPLVGPVVTSMPFLDGGGPWTASDLVEPLITRLIAEAGRAGARHVELRCSHKLAIATAAPMEHKVNMVLGLPSDPDLVWQRIDRAARSQIRKAERSGLSVDFGGADYVDTFYSIFTSRMRELGSPVHAKAFFEAIVDGFGDIELLKRRSGACTGACQGKLCLGTVGEVLVARGRPSGLPTIRPPVRPVPIASLAAEGS